MKTIYNIINRSLLAASISCMALGAVSCDDMLDTKPQGVFTADQMDDAAVEGLMSAAYAGLQSHFFGNNEAFAGPITNWIFDVRSDDAYKGGGGTSMEENIHQLEMSNIQSDNVSVFNKWENNVFAISRCNKAILAVQDAPAIGDKENLIAQLKTLRAYFYFDMIRIYENIPYWTETEDANSASPYQYTRDEIFSFIKKDLADAYKVLPETQSQVGRFNKYAAAAIHAKVSAFTSSWSEVEEYAGYIIDSKKYQLYPNFLDMSKIEYNNMYESLVTIQFSTANNNANINWCNLLNTTYSDGNLFGNGDDFFLASQNLVNAFRTDSNGLPYLDGLQRCGSDLELRWQRRSPPRLHRRPSGLPLPRPYLQHEMVSRLRRLRRVFRQERPYRPVVARHGPGLPLGCVTSELQTHPLRRHHSAQGRGSHRAGQRS